MLYVKRERRGGRKEKGKCMEEVSSSMGKTQSNGGMVPLGGNNQEFLGISLTPPVSDPKREQNPPFLAGGHLSRCPCPQCPPWGSSGAAPTLHHPKHSSSRQRGGMRSACSVTA